MGEKKVWMYAFASVMVTITTLGFGRMSYGIMMPFMMDSLALTYGQAGLLGTIISLGYLGMVLFAGILATKMGSKRLVVIGTFLVACGLFYLSFVQNFIITSIGMTILGIGTAFAYTPLVNIVVGWFPTKRGTMIGFLVSGLGLGTLISSLLIPLFQSYFGDDGWRFLWGFYGILSILSTIVALIILEDPPTQNKQRDIEQKSVVSAVYLNKKVLLVGFIYGLIGFAYLIPQSFIFSFMLESSIHYKDAGKIMAIGGFMSIFSGPLWGIVSDKIGRKHALVIALSVGTVAGIMPVILPVYFWFMIGQFLWGTTVVGMFSLIQALATEQTDIVYAPIALAFTTIFFATGQLLGPGVGGWMIESIGTISSALLFSGSLLAGAFALSMFLKKENSMMLQSSSEERKLS